MTDTFPVSPVCHQPVQQSACTLIWSPVLENQYCFEPVRVIFILELCNDLRCKLLISIAPSLVIITETRISMLMRPRLTLALAGIDRHVVVQWIAVSV